MKKYSLVAVLAAVTLVNFAAADRWALLVAGSNGWWNYRHQADICHAYQILHRNGIPDSNIVTMMYDDIAFNEDNPTPGVIINYPNGPDVYENILKDYTGEEVNPTNFLNVLAGNAAAMKGIGSGKVIQSGPDDTLFLFFSDHGATNLLAFPNNAYLYADDLMKVLNEKVEKKQFKEMVIYLEACESGSMFNGLLPTNVSIYSTTAANPCESSYACYWDAERSAFLGDCYSVNWMLNADDSNLRKETLETQFDIIKAETNQSEVCQYGEMSISKFHVAKFLGYNSSESRIPIEVPKNNMAVDQRDVELFILHRKLHDTRDPVLQVPIKDAINKIRSRRNTIDGLFHYVAKKVVGANYYEALRLPAATNSDIIDYDACSSCQGYEQTFFIGCLKEILTGAEHFCGKFDHYALKYTNWIARMCNYGITPEDFIYEAEQYCTFL